MYPPAADDESTGLVRYLDEQLAALRASILGLTEEQARMTPCRSTLSIGGLIKHATYGMLGTTARLTGDLTVPRELGPDDFAAHGASFALTDDETAAGALAAFDEARPAYLEAVAGVGPDTPTMAPPAPWFGIVDPRPANARFHLVHQIEEMARHAGHADIIREQIDGVAVPTIMLSQAGMPANDFFQPYTPAPGTVGADAPGG